MLNFLRVSRELRALSIAPLSVVYAQTKSSVGLFTLAFLSCMSLSRVKGLRLCFDACSTICRKFVGVMTTVLSMMTTERSRGIAAYRLLVQLLF